MLIDLADIVCTQSGDSSHVLHNAPPPVLADAMRQVHNVSWPLVIESTSNMTRLKEEEKMLDRLGSVADMLQADHEKAMAVPRFDQYTSAQERWFDAMCELIKSAKDFDEEKWLRGSHGAEGNAAPTVTGGMFAHVSHEPPIERSSIHGQCFREQANVGGGLHTPTSVGMVFEQPDIDTAPSTLVGWYRPRRSGDEHPPIPPAQPAHQDSYAGAANQRHLHTFSYQSPSSLPLGRAWHQQDRDTLSSLSTMNSTSVAMQLPRIEITCPTPSQVLADLGVSTEAICSFTPHNVAHALLAEPGADGVVCGYSSSGPAPCTLRTSSVEVESRLQNADARRPAALTDETSILENSVEGVRGEDEVRGNDCQRPTSGVS